MRYLSSISLAFISGIVVTLVIQSLIWWAHYYALFPIENRGWLANAPAAELWLLFRLLVLTLLGWYAGWNAYLAIGRRINASAKPKLGWLFWLVSAVVCAWVSAFLTLYYLPIT